MISAQNSNNLSQNNQSTNQTVQPQHSGQQQSAMPSLVAASPVPTSSLNNKQTVNHTSNANSSTLASTLSSSNQTKKQSNLIIF